MINLLTQYLDVETLFTSGKTELQVVLELREKYEAAKAFEIARAHMNDANRSILVLRLLQWLASYSTNSDNEKKVMYALAELKDARNSAVALQAKKNLMTTTLPSLAARRSVMEQELTRALEIDDGGHQLRNLVSRASNFFDVITSFFFHQKKEFRVASLEIYIRKAYSEHSITLVRPFNIDEYNLALFSCDSAPSSIGLIIPVNDLSDLTANNLLEKVISHYPNEPSRRLLHIAVK